MLLSKPDIKSWARILITECISVAWRVAENLCFSAAIFPVQSLLSALRNGRRVMAVGDSGGQGGRSEVLRRNLFDCSCDLDRVLRFQLDCENGSLENLKTLKPAEFSPSFEGCIAVFCEPDNYHRFFKRGKVHFTMLLVVTCKYRVEPCRTAPHDSKLASMSCRL